MSFRQPIGWKASKLESSLPASDSAADMLVEDALTRYTKRLTGATVASAACAAGAVVVVNEVYDRMVFADASHVSYHEVASHEHSIVISGTAKVYNMTGFDLGWLVSAPAVTDQLADLQFMMHQAMPSSASQHAALAAWTPPLRDALANEGRAVLEANTVRNRGARLFRATEFRHSRSQRSGSTCYGSEQIALYGCYYTTNIAMGSLLYKNTFPR